MTASDPLGLVPGTVERLRFDECASAGGFGVVYRGWDLQTNQPVAIRCLRPTRLAGITPAKRARILERLLEAARSIEPASVEGSDIVRPISSGQLFAPATGEPLAFTAFEWIDGHSLEDDLARRRAGGLPGRSFHDALVLLDGVVRALAHAHGRGILHGAIEPARILLAKAADGGRVTTKLFDFGPPRVFVEELGGLRDVHTDDAQRVFSLAHCAPELLCGDASRLGPATDIHALALVLLEVVHGAALPYPRPTSFRPSSLGITLPASAEDILAHALAATPSDRPADVTTFWSSLRETTALAATSFDANIAAAMEQVRRATSGATPGAIAPFKGTMLMANAPGARLQPMALQGPAPSSPRKPEELARATAPLGPAAAAAALSVTAGLAPPPSPLASSLGPGIVSPVAPVAAAAALAVGGAPAAPPALGPAPALAPAPAPAAGGSLPVAPASAPILSPPQAHTGAEPIRPLHPGAPPVMPVPVVPSRSDSRGPALVVGLLVLLLLAVGSAAAWMLSHPR